MSIRRKPLGRRPWSFGNCFRKYALSHNVPKDSAKSFALGIFPPIFDTVWMQISIRLSFALLTGAGFRYTAMRGVRRMQSAGIWQKKQMFGEIFPSAERKKLQRSFMRMRWISLWNLRDTRENKPFPSWCTALRRYRYPASAILPQRGFLPWIIFWWMTIRLPKGRSGILRKNFCVCLIAICVIRRY